MNSSFNTGIGNKIVSLDDMARIVDSLRSTHGDASRAESCGSHDISIVFTNGCFDLVHRGHVDYLSKARDLGDLLIVGLNSDASVHRLKGEERPVSNQKSRATVLAAFAFVDYVVVFDEDTPINLIKTIRPDILVKGGDYTHENVVGADFVQSYGGRLVLIPLVPGESTSNFINKMKQ